MRFGEHLQREAERAYIARHVHSNHDVVGEVGAFAYRFDGITLRLSMNSTARGYARRAV